VDQAPAAVELTGKERRVLVLRRHQDSVPLVGAEVARRCEAHQRAVVREAGVDDHVLVAAARDARVLDTEPLRVRLEIGQEAAVGVDNPVGEAVGAARHAEVREARAVLDADEQERLAFELRRRGVEDRVHHVRPIVGRQDRVTFVAAEELFAWLAV
jgi:hypothetical protein